MNSENSYPFLLSFHLSTKKKILAYEVLHSSAFLQHLQSSSKNDLVGMFEQLELEYSKTLPHRESVPSLC